MRHITEQPPGHTPRNSRRLDRASELAIIGLLVFVFICELGVLAALVPVGHGFVPKGGGWFTPAVVGGAFTLHPLLIAVPSAACFVLGLLDWRRPWRVEHLDLLALAGFFPAAMLLSGDVPPSRPVAGSRRPQVWLSAYDTKLETVLAGWGLFPIAEPHPAIADTAVTSNALPVSATYLMSSPLWCHWNDRTVWAGSRACVQAHGMITLVHRRARVMNGAEPTRHQ